MSALSRAISKGIEFLSHEQLPNGSFLSLSSPDPKRLTKAYRFKNTFATSLILLALKDLIPEGKVKEIKMKATQFLLNEKSPHWSWNYWSRSSKEAKTIPYPDDLDDTFVALSALYHVDKKIIDGTVMGHVARLLTTTEVTVGGPYRTWLVPKTAEPVWQDVDLAVNSNVAYFLSLHDITLPNLTKLFESAIENNTLSSPYYPTPYPIMYFLSRFYRGNLTSSLISHLLTKQKKSGGSWGNSLTTALALTSLFLLHVPPKKLKKSISHLLSQQKNDGSWEQAAFYTCVNPKQTAPHVGGSKALTTAFCIEALTHYQMRLDTPDTLQHPSFSPHTPQNTLQQLIDTEVKERFSSLPSFFRTQGEKTYAKTREKDPEGNIPLLSFYFADALGIHTLPITLLASLGAANVYGWIAYTIYDDFLDEEGKPITLSLANVCLRELTLQFVTCLSKEGYEEAQKQFTPIVLRTLDTIDAANMWEVASIRTNPNLSLQETPLPDYGDYQILAERSLGHALGPFAILCTQGFAPGDELFGKIQTFFTQYIIAKQLNDDAHDWESDLARGFINPVGKTILEHCKEKNLYQKETISTLLANKTLKKLFWHHLLPNVVSEILLHIKTAEDAVSNSPLILKHTLFDTLLTKQKQVAEKAKVEQQNILGFLGTMKP